MRNRIPQSGEEGSLEGPERYYEATRLDPSLLTRRMSPEFAAGIERVLQEGEALLPQVSQWLVSELEGGRDFRFPGPRLPHDEVVDGRLFEAARDPRNIHISRDGAIGVVVLQQDAPLDIKDPAVRLGGLSGELISLEDALTQRKVVKMGDGYVDRSTFTKVTPIYRAHPVYLPLALWTGERGPNAHINPTLEDVSALNTAQRETLLRYGQALFEISGMNAIHANTGSMANYDQYLQSHRAAMQRILDQLPPEGSAEEA